MGLGSTIGRVPRKACLSRGYGIRTRWHGHNTIILPLLYVLCSDSTSKQDLACDEICFLSYIFFPRCARYDMQDACASTSHR